LSLLTIIVLKLISNSYGGIREVIDTDIMDVHPACFFVHISFAVAVKFPIERTFLINFIIPLRILTIIIKKITCSFCHFFDARNTRDQGFFRFKFSKVGGAQNTRVSALLETLRYLWQESSRRQKHILLLISKPIVKFECFID
jgi:hypothetical protein